MACDVERVAQLFAYALLAVVTCFPSAQAAPSAAPGGAKTGALRVHVTEEGSGKPVRFANVFVVGTDAPADTTGQATLGGLTPGQWTVRVQVIRRDPEIDTVTVVPGETTFVDMRVGPLTRLEPDCVLEVRPMRKPDWSSAAVRTCPWRLVSARPAGPGVVPFDGQVPMLADPDDANSAPGPGTLRAVVRNLRGHHPSVLIQDVASGSSRLLKPWAWQPKWSPDGRWIACNTYGSVSAPYNLALVELGSGRVWQPHLGAQIDEYRWSPDSQRLALELVTAEGGFTVLGFFALSTGTFTPLDTLALFAEHDFRGSPDSRTLAVSKPTFTDPSSEGEVTQSDLWLMDVSGARCRLVEGKGFLAAEPRWIDSVHIRYQREVWKLDGSGSANSVVLALARSR